MVASAHLKLAFKWIALLNTLDYAGMASVMSANFTNRERPTSMGFPPVGKQEYIDRLKASPIGYFNISLPTPENIVEDAKTIQFYTNANGKSTHGFPFLNEYIFTFTFEGDKLLSVDEFVDPKIIFELINNETIAAAAELNC